MHNSGTMHADLDVLVVGAGISGLTLAHRLARRGLDVEVIDAASHVGGVIGTERNNGVLYERGPNSILDTSPLIDDLLLKLDLLEERIEMNPRAARRYVVRKGRLAALPTSPGAFVTTRLFSTRAKLRLLGEPFVARAPAGAEESIAQFVTRRLGRELLDYAIEPFVAGVYAGNPDELSVSAAFPRLHALEARYGSLIKGQIKGSRERAAQAEKSRHAAKSFSFENGMQALVDALARSVSRIRTDVRATRVARAQDGTLTVTTTGPRGTAHVRAQAVALCVPADAAAGLVRDFAPDAATALEEIPYAPVASVARAYARADVGHPLDGFGFLAPRIERRRILGCLFSSSTFENRAPDGTVLLTAFVGGRRNPELALQAEAEIECLVNDELAALLGVRGAPSMSAVTRWRRAIPQYTLGHHQRLARATQAEVLAPGLFLCASYRGGVAVGDCIKSAYQAADALAGYLHHLSQPRQQ
jgi:oxygen-dependent protoporphyrinogen oxidase